jgi:hypothetical protein
MPVIGFLGSASPDRTAPLLAAFHQGLGETGYVEGQNLAFEYRWAEGRYDRLPALAADLVVRKVDLIAADGIPATLAAKTSAAMPGHHDRICLIRRWRETASNSRFLSRESPTLSFLRDRRRGSQSVHDWARS